MDGQERPKWNKGWERVDKVWDCLLGSDKDYMCSSIDVGFYCKDFMKLNMDKYNCAPEWQVHDTQYKSKEQPLLL